MSEKEKQEAVKEEEQSQEEQAEGRAEDAAEQDPKLDLQAELEQAQAKAAENLEGWQRAQAEFANYKKRQSRDQEQIYQDLQARVIKRYLEIADDLERALANRPEEGAGADWAAGVELIYRKLLAFLESEGVQQMEALGEAFDPNLHEAIAKESSEEYESEQIIEVIQPGYFIGERVLRPAIVKVAE